MKWCHFFLGFLVVLFLSAGTRSDATLVKKNVLFLYGGEVGPEHEYILESKKVARLHRLSVRVADIQSEIPFVEDEMGQFSAIIIGDYAAYVRLLPTSKAKLDAYCRVYNVGLFFLYLPEPFQLNSGQVFSWKEVEISQHTSIENKGFWTFLRGGTTIHKKMYGRFLTVNSGTGYQSLIRSTSGSEEGTTVLLDRGHFDGVRRIFFGIDFSQFWLAHVIFLDCLQWLSPIALPLGTDRWVGIDIDDIFLPVPANHGAVKMQGTDVEALLHAQQSISTQTGNQFRFHLGYNSDWFEKTFSGQREDVEGDRKFVQNRGEFYWFDHLPAHQKSSKYSQAELETLMKKSKKWAAEHGIEDLIGKYHVPPYHDGVAPVYSPLFAAWKSIWQTAYTSTVFTNPGFVEEGIFVAPRTDLGLASHVWGWKEVNQEHLLEGARGGFLFMRLLINPVSIIMTHQANFARDRMALVIFQELVRFVKQWTNLNLINLPGDGLVQKHFELGNLKYIH